MEHYFTLNNSEFAELLAGVLEYNGKVLRDFRFLDTAGSQVEIARLEIEYDGAVLAIRTDQQTAIPAKELVRMLYPSIHGQENGH